jgi:multiple RNA-binding domain-containing protein 1
MTCRKGVKDAPASRPNKRPRIHGPEREPVSSVVSPRKLRSEKSDANVSSKGEDDALTAQFLDVMKPRHSKGPAWADNELTKLAVTPTNPSSAAEPSPASQELGEQNKMARGEMSDLEWMKSRMADIHEDKGFEQSEDEDDQKDIPLVDATKVNCSPPCNVVCLGGFDIDSLGLFQWMLQIRRR